VVGDFKYGVGVNDAIRVRLEPLFHIVWLQAAWWFFLANLT